jgi:hypothetical protein
MVYVHGSLKIPVLLAVLNGWLVCLLVSLEAQIWAGGHESIPTV